MFFGRFDDRVLAAIGQIEYLKIERGDNLTHTAEREGIYTKKGAAMSEEGSLQGVGKVDWHNCEGRIGRAEMPAELA